jgi:hypothetical protein
MDKAVKDWQLKRTGKTVQAAKEHFSAANEVRLESKSYLKDILAGANPVIVNEPTPASPGPDPITPTRWVTQ